MNTNRLIHMAIRMVTRHLMKGQKLDPRAKKAADAMKLARKLKR